MKTLKTFSVFVALLGSLIFLAGCGPRKYVATADELLYGTWINQKANNQKLVTSAVGWEAYVYMNDQKPTYTGTLQIVDKWKDADGNTWYKTYGTITFGAVIGTRGQDLWRVSADGSRVEDQNTAVREFDPKSFPAKIDPSDRDNYGVYYRTKN